MPITGLHTDAISFVAEVIESKPKPSMPWGDLGILAVWAVVGLGAAGRFFRWE